MNELTITNKQDQYTSIAPLSTHDEDVISMWLHGKSPNTQRKYRQQINHMLDFTRKPIQLLTLPDLQLFADSLEHLSLSSQGMYLSAIKSLLSFAHRVGYTKVNVGVVISVPKHRDSLNERILSENQVHQMLMSETKLRNKVLLRLMYASGVRVSELCELRWQDIFERSDGRGQITVYGKGSKTRTILLSTETWDVLSEWRSWSHEDSLMVFPGQNRDQLTVRQVRNIIHKAAERAGISLPVSPHWLRHAHASHSLERGAPLHLVKETLGHRNIATTGRYLHARPTDSSGLYLGV